MPLVSGYDSDSDNDNDNEPLPFATLKGKCARDPSKGIDPNEIVENDSIQDDPPSNGKKRKVEKLQIRIGSLHDDQDESKKKKRTKLAAAEKKTGGHSLLNIFPAPKNKEPFLPAKKKEETVIEEESEITNKLGIQSSSSSGAMTVVDSKLDNNKSKGNDDFRAMLGLKPFAEARKKTDLPQKDSFNVHIHEERRDEEQNATIAARRDSSPFIAEDKIDSEGIESYHHSSLKISAAPKVEKESFTASKELGENIFGYKDTYQGWQQGPNGEWFPITPEAHQEFQQYLFEQSQEKEGVSNLSHHRSPRTKTDQDRGKASTHARFAGQGQSYVPTPDQSEEQEKKGDKLINLRAKRKGQLSSLIAQAEEKKDKLEERWAKGRSARNEAKSRYGF